MAMVWVGATTPRVARSVPPLRGVCGRRSDGARATTRAAAVDRRVSDRAMSLVARAAKDASAGEEEGAEARRAKRREARRERGAGASNAAKKKTASGDEEEESGTPKWMEVLQENAEKDPEIAALLEGTNGNPQAIEEKIRARFAEKQEKIYQERSGSTVPTLVTFREYNPFGCWIWIESHNPIAEMERPLLEEVFKAWFVLGRLGGFNSYNMQAQENFDSVSFMDYSMEQAHEFSTDTSTHVFHEMSEVEFKVEWARVYVDLGTADEMALDVLINSLIQFSREYYGLKQIIIGGENEDWSTEGSEFGGVDLEIDETFGRGPRGQLSSR
jgi:hypothetical protein